MANGRANEDARTDAGDAVMQSAAKLFRVAWREASKQARRSEEVQRNRNTFFCLTRGLPMEPWFITSLYDPIPTPTPNLVSSPAHQNQPAAPSKLNHLTN